MDTADNILQYMDRLIILTAFSDWFTDHRKKIQRVFLIQYRTEILTVIKTKGSYPRELKYLGNGVRRNVIKLLERTISYYR